MLELVFNAQHLEFDVDVLKAYEPLPGDNSATIVS